MQVRLLDRFGNVETGDSSDPVTLAIATGPGLECWMAPAEIAGGKVHFDMGDGMAEAGVITVVEPPHRFAYEERWDGGVLAS